jgi:hypothetical protein
MVQFQGIRGSEGSDMVTYADSGTDNQLIYEDYCARAGANLITTLHSSSSFHLCSPVLTLIFFQVTSTESLAAHREHSAQLPVRGADFIDSQRSRDALLADVMVA